MTLLENIRMIATIVVFILFLIGCKSSGSGDSGQDVITNNPNGNNDPELTEVSASMTDLIAPKDMKFISHTQSNLRIALATEHAAFISVYSRYEKNGSSYKIDYGSRMLGGSLQGGTKNTQLTYPQHLTTALVQIWFYDDTVPVITQEVALADDILITSQR